MVLVRDLIKRLETLPPDLPVLVASVEMCDGEPLLEVEEKTMVHCQAQDEPEVYFDKELWDETWSGIYNRVGKPWVAEPRDVRVVIIQ